MPVRPAKSAKQILINPGSSGVVYTADGHSLGGGERCEVEGIDDVAKAAIDNGYLLTEAADDKKS